MTSPQGRRRCALGLALVLLAGATLALAQKPLTKAEVDDLVLTKSDSQRVAKVLQERGVDFQPSETYLESLRSKGVKPEVLDALQTAAPDPLSKSAIVRLLKNGTSDRALAAAVQRRGLSFRPSDDDLDDIRIAGGGDLLDGQLQKTRQTMAPPESAASTADSKTPSTGEESTTGQVYEAGSDVTPPEPTYQPAPVYSREARKARVSGVATLAVIIDTQGNVADAKIQKGVGYGLDEKAVETVKTWKFRPATRRGVPVKARVLVEVTFAFDAQHPASP